jgi:RNA polymerase sigma-70 factor (ECF subfamily)
MKKCEEPAEITVLLQACKQGDASAKEKLVKSLYGELRRLAAHMMRDERPGHTLQPTALVNELFLKLFSGNEFQLAENKSHLFAIAARAMRHLLVDHARRKYAHKRGAGLEWLPLNANLDGQPCPDESLLEIHESLSRLETINARQSQVVELRVFGGLTVQEIAAVLGVTTRTVDRDWQFAKAWLHAQLGAHDRKPMARS